MSLTTEFGLQVCMGNLRQTYFSCNLIYTSSKLNLINYVAEGENRRELGFQLNDEKDFSSSQPSDFLSNQISQPSGL